MVEGIELKPKTNSPITDGIVTATLLCPELLVNGRTTIDPLQARRRAPYSGQEVQQILFDGLGTKGEIYNFPKSLKDSEKERALRRDLHQLKANVQGGTGFQVIAFPEIIYAEDCSQSRPTFIGFTERDGWVPLIGASLKRDIGKILSLHPSRILNEIGFYSGAGVFFNRPASFDGWRVDRCDFSGSFKTKLLNALEITKKILRGEYHPTPAWTDLCKNCWFKDDCFDGMPGSHDLTLISGLNRTELNKLVGIGVNTIDDLLARNATEIAEAFAAGNTISQQRIEKFQRLARFMREGVIVQVADIPKPQAKHQIYLDVESFVKYEGYGNFYDFIFHHGCIYVGPDGKKVYLSATSYSDEPKAEKEAFERFWNDLRERTNGFEETTVYHYGNHDRRTSSATAKRYGFDESIFPLGNESVEFVDVLPIMRSALESPWGYSLKTIATVFWDESWKTAILGQLKELNPGTAKFFHDMANLHVNTPLEEVYANGLKSYNGRDVWYLYLFMNGFKNAKRLRRS